jgi:LPPG:FO 2-phospho-L-lactate transferase
VIDTVDADLAGDVEAAGMRCVVTPTVMSTPAAPRALALACLDAATR